MISDTPSVNERLLTPPVEDNKNTIRLIPPKPATETSENEKIKLKTIDEVQKLQEEKEAIKEKHKKEIEAARKEQEKKRKLLEEAFKKLDAARQAEEERKQKELEANFKQKKNVNKKN